jgi:hypothetical protein
MVTEVKLEHHKRKIVYSNRILVQNGCTLLQIFKVFCTHFRAISNLVHINTLQGYIKLLSILPHFRAISNSCPTCYSCTSFTVAQITVYPAASFPCLFNSTYGISFWRRLEGYLMNDLQNTYIYIRRYRQQILFMSFQLLSSWTTEPYFLAKTGYCHLLTYSMQQSPCW